MNTAGEEHQAEVNDPFWAEPRGQLLAGLGTSTEGLSEVELLERSRGGATGEREAHDH
jgi:hypothetical protein